MKHSHGTTAEHFMKHSHSTTAEHFLKHPHSTTAEHFMKHPDSTTAEHFMKHSHQGQIFFNVLKKKKKKINITAWTQCVEENV